MVTNITQRELEQLNRLRFTLESLIIDIICEENSKDDILTLNSFIFDTFEESDNASDLNFRFHMALSNLTKDAYLVNILENILGSALRVEQSISYTNRENWQDFHRGIVSALLKRDAAKAKEHLLADIGQR